MTTTFAELGLAEPLLRAVREQGYETPTPIQAQAVPQVMRGGDLLAAAQTGTGKTAGFTLPILHRLHQAHKRPGRPGQPRVLILTPTRELAAQVEASVQTYGAHLPFTTTLVFGGVSAVPQIARLKRPVDILVATPGRLLDHVSQRTVDLTAVEILVLDEADRMLDMGFIRDIRKILALLPTQRQNLLFSATYSADIRELATGLLQNPAVVEIARRTPASELVSQSVHMVDKTRKKDLLLYLIQTEQWRQALVFTRTKHGANKLAEFLGKRGVAADAIHGNKSQGARMRALDGFKGGQVQVLVATDIAARGLDIDLLPQVVNYELPQVPEDYVHRIGRTGRAGSEGRAVSLVCGEEMKLLKDIEKVLKRAVERVEVDGFTSAQISVPLPDPRTERAKEGRPLGFRKGSPAQIRVQGSGASSDRRPQSRPSTHGQEDRPARASFGERASRPASGSGASTGQARPARPGQGSSSRPGQSRSGQGPSSAARPAGPRGPRPQTRKTGRRED